MWEYFFYCESEVDFLYQLCGVNKKMLNWFIFIILSVIWGSSFILMKIGLTALSAYQVASLRIFFAGLCLLPAALKYIPQIPSGKLLLVFLSGTIGNLIPAYLFCFAEMKIDSTLAGTLNSLTPIFVVLTGAVFFRIIPSLQKTLGIFVAFMGSVLLVSSKGSVNVQREITYVLMVVLATIMYGYNINMVARSLKNIPSLHIAAVAFALNAIPALVVLISTSYFSMPLLHKEVLIATGSAAVLGIIGTAISTVIFYKLVKGAGGIFASMVTYGIPVVSIGWGVIYREQVGLWQVLSLVVILSGVYISNLKTQKFSNNVKAHTK